MLGAALDVFRLRQYFDVITRGRQWVEGLREDAGLLDDARRVVLPLPSDEWAVDAGPAFPPPEPFVPRFWPGSRVAVVATGGSGALASVIGVARAMEEAGIRPAALSLCSGSAMFGFPLAAGIPPSDVARFFLDLRPGDYLDPDWPMLLRLVPTAARGFGGLVRGDAIEATFQDLLGDRRLGDLAIPAHAPIWNVEENRLEFLGPRSHPDLPVARAVRMAIALPLFFEPVELDGRHWCDGGIVDIFPVTPLLEDDEPYDAVIGVNGFYPPGFVGEDETGWEERPASILYLASQVRTCQQVQLARENLARLQAATEVAMIEPVPYRDVRGVGFYRQFMSSRDWGASMRAGRDHARRVLQDAPAGRES